MQVFINWEESEMALLILTRFSINQFPVNKWFDECNEKKIVFIQEKYKHEYIGKGFFEVKSFVNYDFDAAIEIAAIDVHEKHKITKIFAFDERDVERAGRLRSFLNIPGQQYESALAYRNKLIMKRMLSMKGITVPSFKKIDTVYDILKFVKKYNYPILIKPINLYSAINIKRIDNKCDLETYLNQID